ncbi:MAG TPA: hypothetical protein VGE34_03930 [Candidatus Saccharimonadales bacterium]
MRQSVAHAVQASDWKAGNIISDVTFTKKDSMSSSQIQTFLNQKIGTCDINGTKNSEYDSRYTRAEYAQKTWGLKPPFTCLNKYYEVPKTTPGGSMPANNYSNPSTIPTGAKSAAWIIKDAANRYNISPKVLLVKIATESVGPLTSDQWPLFSQYRYAMGAHCPDSGPGGSANCDQKYAGFSIQMYEAAKLIRGYLDNMDESWWPYRKPYTNNRILWNVEPSGCGAGNVYIQNKATAALYTYTPYQPNQAALNNMYGTGNSCSAYGNRNFWRVFVDWFGDSRTDGFSKLETPRWFSLKTTAYKKEPLSGQNVDSPIASGTQLRFTTKIYINGTWYMRTEWDSTHGYMKGIPIEQLQEISYEAFETPRWMVFNKNDYKLNPVSGQKQPELYNNQSSLYFSSKITVNGILYYRTKWSTDNSVPEAFPATSMSEAAATPLESPRWMAARNTAYQKDLSKSTIPNTSTYSTQNSHLYFSKKILLNGTWYFISRGTSSEMLAYSWSDFKELPLTFAKLSSPQVMKLKLDTFKQDPASERSVDTLLKKDSQLYFTSKLSINGKWYMRTQYDTQRGHMKVIPLEKLAAV